MNFRKLVLAVVVLWLAGTLAGFAAQVPTEAGWLPVALEAVAYICGMAALALLVGGGFWFLWRLIRPWLEALPDAPPEAPKPLVEIGQAHRTMASLAQLLADAEQDTNKAGVLLSDAQVYAGHLARLIQAIALKAEDMLGQIESLEAAMAAIAGQDPLEIAQAAGKVRDEHIRELMTCKVKDREYWLDTARLIALHLGTLRQWEQGYRTFTSNLLSELGQAKARLAASAAALELVGAGRPLMQIQASLSEAGELLRLERKPGLALAARTLPAINAGLMRPDR